MPAPNTSRAPRFTTGEVAAMLKAELRGPADIAITRLDAIDDAGPSSLTFIRSGRFASQWRTSKAGAALVTQGIEVPGHDPARRALLFVPNAEMAMIPLLEAFATRPPAAPPGIHPSANIDSSARIDPTASIGPLCVVGAGATIGARSILKNSVSIEPAASVGEDCLLHPGVVLGTRCSIGKACILHAHVVIGADGFGFRPTGRGTSLAKVPHIGDVRIGDEVEIGAGSCIDRGKFGSTTIGNGTKIDNLVQIAHNCRIGRDCIICGLCGLAGSVTLGDGVILAGQVGIVDGLTIGDGARIGAQSGVTTDVPAGESWLGTPAGPGRLMAKNYAIFRSLAEHIRELRKHLREGVKQEP